MPITIWLGTASSRLSFSSHIFQPSFALANAVGLTTTLLSGRVMHPEQDWLPMSIPQTYLISASLLEEAAGVVSITHLDFFGLPLPWSPPRCHLSPGKVERETRRARASVSSSWIGNLAQATAFHVTSGCCNKPHRPLRLWPTGSRLEKEVTAFRRPRAATQALPLPLNYYMSGLSMYDQASFNCRIFNNPPINYPIYTPDWPAREDWLSVYGKIGVVQNVGVYTTSIH